ncbi:porphobilinogen synthase [Litorimonas sp.]|uniref:porphobilinogen synthase n=1 Tax=Litorimonas sp. TaxID=1892381 RepID=UPI003A838910
MSHFPTVRMRRTRAHDWSRRLVRETRPAIDDLIWTLVITDSKTELTPVDSLPGVSRLNLDALMKASKEAEALGIPAIALFPHIEPKHKDAQATESLNEKGLVPEAVRAVKAACPNLGVIVDVALDPYTDHGHDGVLVGDIIENDPTLSILAESAVILAKSGADIVAPSDMMDGRVGAIRDALDEAKFGETMIMSYAAKYASGFYGPYRDAIGTKSALRGDKRTYQMDPANRMEAIREVELDVNEGADMIMVKPGLPYLDIIRDLKNTFAMPTFAFQVSGEYAMIKAAGANGSIDEKSVMMESFTSFRRAGCDGVLTYFARDIARILQN